MADGGGDRKPLSKATILYTVKALQRFFRWLVCQPGFKSKIELTDINYFNLSEKDIRAATSPKPKSYPSLEQFGRALFAMPSLTEIEQRDRAVMALAIVTGMRDSALISLRLKHIDLDRKLVMQDPSEVRTKNSKRIDTFFFPVGDEIEAIIAAWVQYLRAVRCFGIDDPLLPRTVSRFDAEMGFTHTAVEPRFWANTAPVRAIFKRAFEAVDLPYFSPHRVRDTLAQLGQQQCYSAEAWKAWSQNFGHENVQSTWVSYGRVTLDRQGELVRDSTARPSSEAKVDRILELLENRRE
jgi:integrase